MITALLALITEPHGVPLSLTSDFGAGLRAQQFPGLQIEVPANLLGLEPGCMPKGLHEGTPCWLSLQCFSKGPPPKQSWPGGWPSRALFPALPGLVLLTGRTPGGKQTGPQLGTPSPQPFCA